MDCRPVLASAGDPSVQTTRLPGTTCDTLGAMDNKKEDTASTGRLKNFAEIYREKMKAKPYMELIARYDSMTEAGLLVGERVKADLYLETHRFNELLYPEKLAIVANEN